MRTQKATVSIHGVRMFPRSIGRKGTFQFAAPAERFTFATDRGSMTRSTAAPAINSVLPATFKLK